LNDFNAFIAPCGLKHSNFYSFNNWTSLVHSLVTLQSL